ncbi:hypothetical protein [Flavobacterium muglaense]|uniref:Uncharacterized protein n=1 Tax=Flavobacterium muglaense TaxID=2764716 RepID=A0A923N2N0_9FLAO|nr:hypothetical protein [Flavobacterium muglaense]MBC5839210.1 hypothetical protein [Flavobacterium muglaense]MBC5845685.1 hypothetical protein [Flavobacterium muglaense]
MSKFKKIAIYVNEQQIESSIAPQENRFEYFQQLIDMYNDLNTGVVLEKNDLKALLNNPKKFVATRLIKDQEVSFGGLKLSLEKVFDIIEKPAGTDELIDKIINDNQVRELMMNQRNVEYFEIKNGDTVVINSEYLHKVTEQCTVYIETEKQAQAYKALQSIVENINELNGLKSRGYIQDLLFTDLLELNHSTGTVAINPYFTKQIL